MADPIRIDFGAKAAYDVIELDHDYQSHDGPGGEVSLGLGYKLNPRDRVSAIILASANGLFHRSQDLRFIAGSPELGVGVVGKNYFSSISGGPMWTGTSGELGATGVFEIGFNLSDHSAFVLGARYMLLPKLSQFTETHTEVDITDYNPVEFEIVERTTVFDQDASIIRSFIGFKGIF